MLKHEKKISSASFLLFLEEWHILVSHSLMMFGETNDQVLKGLLDR